MKMIVKVGEIRGSFLHLRKGALELRHTTHKIIGGKLVYVSSYQDKYRVPDRVEAVA